MLHSVPQNLTREFCYFLKITTKQQNRHAKLIVQVVMQSMDEAGNISWCSLISVTSSFPARGETTWDLFHGRRDKKESSKAGATPFCVHMSSFPNIFCGSNRDTISAYSSCLKAPLPWHWCTLILPARSQNTHSEQLSSDGRSIATNFLTSWKIWVQK